MTHVQKWCLGLILLTAAAFSVAYNVLQPLWEAPDEPAHFGYIRYVQIHHALPRARPDVRAFTEPWDLTSEYSQAPLYYVVLAVALEPLRLLPDARPHLNPYVAWPGHPWREAVALHRTDEIWPYHGLALFLHLGRLVSTVLGLVTLVAAFGLVKTMTDRASDALVATAWLAGTPSFILTSSRLDNDAAAMAMGALTLLMCARLLAKRKRVRPANLLVLSLCLTGALLSKLDTVFLIPLVAAAVAIATEPGVCITTLIGRRIAMSALTLAIPLALLTGWWIGYGRTSQSVVGAKAGFGVLQVWTVVEGIEWKRLLAAFWNWNATGWGGVGWGTLTLWPPVVYAILAVPLVGLAGAGLWSLTQRHSWPEEATSKRLAAVLIVLSAAPIFYATIVRQAVASIGLDSNARFTLPAAPVVALVVVLGARYLPIGRFRRPLAVVYLAVTFGLAVATAVVLLPKIPAPVIPARLAVSDQELTGPALATFADGVDLLAVRDISPTLTPGGIVSVDLRWRVASAPGRDFTAFVQLRDAADGRKVAGSDAIPHQRMFPPRLWQEGEIVDDLRRVPVPPSLAPGVYTLVVGTYYLDGDTPRPINILSRPQSENTVVVQSWYVLPNSAGLSRAHPSGALFGQDLVLRGYAIQHDGDVLKVSLYWEAKNRIQRNLVVSVQLLGADHHLISQSDEEPVDGRLPTTAWPIGQPIRDDHSLQLRRASERTHTIVVVYDRQSLRRLPVSAPGQAASDHLVIGGSGQSS